MEKKELTQEQLEQMAERGRRAAEFGMTKFWEKDLQPELARLQNDCAMAVLWAPGDGNNVDPGQIAVKTAFYSGRSKAAEDMILILNRFVRDGREAEQKMKPPEEKK